MNTTRHFYSIMDLANEFLQDFDTMAPPKLPDFYCSSSFPPCDIIKLKDNSLRYTFAIAGYNDDEVSIKFDNDKLILALEPIKKEEDENLVYRQKGIKKAKLEASFYVPVSHYDVEKATASLDKGLLSIDIPSKEVAKPKLLELKPKRVEIADK